MSCAWASEVDQVRRDEWNAHERSHTKTGKWIKGTRWSLLKSPAKQTIGQLALLHEVQQANQPLYRAFLLKEELRVLYQLEDPALAPEHLDAWLAWATRSRLDPFIKIAPTIRRHRNGILKQLRLPLSRPPDRPGLPLLQPHRHPPPNMTSTHKPTGAPILSESGRDCALLLVLAFSVVVHVALWRPAGGDAISRRVASPSLRRTGLRRTVQAPPDRTLVRCPMGVSEPRRLLAGAPPGV
jgi:hypothetical protein